MPSPAVGTGVEADAVPEPAPFVAVITTLQVVPESNPVTVAVLPPIYKRAGVTTDPSIVIVIPVAGLPLDHLIVKLVAVFVTSVMLVTWDGTLVAVLVKAQSGCGCRGGSI